MPTTEAAVAVVVDLGVVVVSSRLLQGNEEHAAMPRARRTAPRGDKQLPAVTTRLADGSTLALDALAPPPPLLGAAGGAGAMGAGGW